MLTKRNMTEIYLNPKVKRNITEIYFNPPSAGCGDILLAQIKPI